MNSRLPPSTKDRKSLNRIAIGIFALFSLLIAQFFRIQVVEEKRWAKTAQRQHEFIISEPFKRGTFISNSSVKLGHPENIQPFAIDVPKFHLHIDPISIPKKYRNEIAKKLLSFLNVPTLERENILHEFSKKSRDRKIAMWLHKKTRDMIVQWWFSYSRERKIARNAIFFVNDYQRSYPCGKLLGQVLHTIRDAKDSLTKQGIPTGGLEFYFNEELKGTQGKRRLLRSPRNSLEIGNVIIPPENGADIYLTVNHYLQAIAEKEIKRGVKKSQAKSGWAVMMNPKTGEILALAQYPFFYPSEYQNYYNDPLLVEHARSKAVTDGYEPASTMKPLTMAICLKANEELLEQKKKPLFSIDEKMNTKNGSFPGRSKPLVDGRTHNFLNMFMALQKSSNVYIGKIIHRLMETLGAEWYRNSLQETFGFGKETRIELPAEHPGHMPTPGKKHPNGTLEWSLPTPYSLGIGHNIQVNGIQMLRAYSPLANGGYLVQPTLVRKIVKTHINGSKEILLDNTTSERIKKFPHVLNQEIVNEVVKAMKFVTKPGGTARSADINGYTEAGKTGTAKKIVNGSYSNKHYVSTFIGFTPVNDPQILLLVLINEPKAFFIPGIGKNHHGGQCAAPVFREISKKSLEYLGITPDDPFGYPNGDPRHSLEKADWISEVKELKNMYNEWNEENPRKQQDPL